MASKKSGSTKKSNGASGKKSSSSKGRSSYSYETKAKKQAVKYAKKHKKGVAIACAVIVLALIVAFILIYVLKPQWFDQYLDYVMGYYYDTNDDDPAGTVAKSSDPVEAGTLTGISESEFSIHFLELGNKYTGDCTLIKCGDTEVLIDAGSRTNSAKPINEYIAQYCTDNVLEYVVATHAHQDHIAGFVGVNQGNTKDGILYEYSQGEKSIGTIIQFARHNSNANVYKNYATAVEYAQTNKDTKVYTALQCWNNADGAKRSYALNESGTLTLNVLYNYYYENDTDDENDYSVCLLLSYSPEGGNAKHYLFTGDLEGKGESYLVDNNDLPEVELFKGAHHGSKTSSTDKLLSAIKPKNVAVCCCAGATEYTTNNDNTFPTQAFVDRISKYTANVYCTTLCTDYKGGKFESMNGNIVFYIEGGDLKLWCSNNTTRLKDTDWFKNNRKCPTEWTTDGQ